MVAGFKDAPQLNAQYFIISLLNSVPTTKKTMVFCSNSNVVCETRESGAMCVCVCAVVCVYMNDVEPAY